MPEYSRAGLEWGDIIREATYVRALMTYPSDDFSAYLDFQARTTHAEAVLKKARALYRSDKDLQIAVSFGLVRAERNPEFVRLSVGRLNKRETQGLSAGFMAHFCLDLHNAGLGVSLNKAAHITAKVSIENYNEHRINLKTGTKRILSNLREHRSVCHYWAAEILCRQSWVIDPLRQKMHNADEYSMRLWKDALLLYWAEHFRVGLSRIPGLGAELWGMRPRLTLYSSQDYAAMPSRDDWLKEMLSDYENPNVGPL